MREIVGSARCEEVACRKLSSVLQYRRQNAKDLKKSSDQNSISHKRKINISLAPPRAAASQLNWGAGEESMHRPLRYVGADVPLWHGEECQEAMGLVKLPLR